MVTRWLSAQFFSADGQRPTGDPSKFFASDFKGKFVRSGFQLDFDDYRHRLVDLSRPPSEHPAAHRQQKHHHHSSTVGA
jgi:hypothetical protein